VAGDGTTYSIDIDVGADGVEPAAAAVARMGESLAGASAAAAQAAEAVKAGEAAYKAAESAADRAAKAVEKIGIAADAQRGKLAAAMNTGDERGAERAAAALQKLVARQAEAAAKADVATSAMKDEAAALDKLKAAATGASATQSKLAKDLEAAKKSAEAVKSATGAAAGSGDVGKIGSAFGKLGGPLGSVGQKAADATEGFQHMAEAVGSAGPYVALAVVIVALTTAIAAATIAAAVWAVKLSDGARSARLLSAGIAGSADGGWELEESIKALSKRVPQTRDELRSMAADLAKTGLKGDDLAKALEDSAEKAATLKWGPEFAKQTKSLGKLSERFSNNLSDLFGRLDIEPLLDGLSKLVDLFDSGSVTGKVMRDVFESLFQPLIDGVANVIPKVIAGFIQVQIWILKALIAIKPFGSEIMFVAEAVGTLLVTSIAMFAAGIALAVAIVTAAVAAIALLVQGVIWLWDALTNANKAVGEFFANLSFKDIGTNLIAGLVEGIAGGAGSVIKALTGVVGGAVDAAKSALGIASPSKVFAEIGMNTAEGMAVGVEDGTGAVAGALETMVEPPSADGAAPAASASGGGGGIYHITIQAPANGVEAMVQVVRETLTSLVEGDVAQLGAEAPANA
jgi:hypothetical protein